MDFFALKIPNFDGAFAINLRSFIHQLAFDCKIINQKPIINHEIFIERTYRNNIHVVHQI